MAFIFKPVVTSKRTDDCKGKRRRARFWWASYVDAKGKTQRKALTLPSGEKIGDRETAEQRLSQILKLEQRRAVGLIDRSVESAGMPIRTVIAGWIRHLRQNRRSRVHIRKSLQRAKWVVGHAGIERLADMNAEKVGAALGILVGRDKAPKTVHEYRAVMRSIGQWAFKVRKLLDCNPVDDVPTVETGGDVRKQRRALSPEEAGRLLEQAGPRRLWYSVALHTGLRVAELDALQWGDVDLDADKPAIHLRAMTTKAKRGDTIPLKQTVADELRGEKPPFAKPTDKVFKRTPVIETFWRDCTKAGIEYRPDSQGKSLDRHSLRKTFVTWLARSGVHQRTTQKLARHTDPRLTAGAYTDPMLLDGWAAVESLPEIPTPQHAEAVAQLNGTDGKSVVLPVVLKSRESPCNAMKSDSGQKFLQVGSSIVTPCNSSSLRQIAEPCRTSTNCHKNARGGNRTPTGSEQNPQNQLENADSDPTQEPRCTVGCTAFPDRPITLAELAGAVASCPDLSGGEQSRILAILAKAKSSRGGR